MHRNKSNSSKWNCGGSKLNIENMVNKSKKNMAYTMLDATGAVNDALAAKLSAIPAVVRVRIL